MNGNFKSEFDVEARAWKVHRLSIENFLKYKNNNGIRVQNQLYGRQGILIETGIYSERTAHLLNYIFNFKRCTASNRFDFYFDNFIDENETQVKIYKFNEIYLQFLVQNREILSQGFSIKPKIYKRVKNVIDEFIHHFFSNKNAKYDFNDNGFIINGVIIEELKLLRDYFNSIDVKNVYSSELFNKVIGQTNKNQFVISASEMLENQLKNLVEKRDKNS